MTQIILPLIFRPHRLLFGVSALTFRCKLCIPLGTTFELLLVFFSFSFALDGAFPAFTFTSLGDIALIK
jgi:hypothetical protein